MSKVLSISIADIFYHIKLSGQIPLVLEGIANRKIINDAAVAAGITVATEELQQAADSLRLFHKLIKAEDTWAWLEKHHLTLDDFEEIAKNNILSTKLASHLFADKVEPFFYEHQLDYMGAVTYEVILDDEDLALELYYSLRENEISFQEIARQYIQHPEIRRTGGYQGIRRRQDFRPEIAALVFAAKPPQILKPITTPQGVHIIVVEEILKPQLDEQMRQSIIGDFFTNWLKQQTANVEIFTQFDPNPILSTPQDVFSAEKAVS